MISPLAVIVGWAFMPTRIMQTNKVTGNSPGDVEIFQLGHACSFTIPPPEPRSALRKKTAGRSAGKGEKRENGGLRFPAF
jgi:hypothetical protein